MSELFANLDASHFMTFCAGANLIIMIDAIFDRRAALAAYCMAVLVFSLVFAALHAGGV